MIKQNVSKILETEMERKDFLKLIGLGAVAAVGVTAILKAVTPSQDRTKAAKTDGGYGSMAYGGTKEVRS
jgi:hypothetical protein